MRIRNIAICALCIVLGGGGLFLFSSGTKGLPVGASGLPLIKADTTPVKVAPEEPASEIMPNSDSTVFTAMGKATQADPSMQNIKTPAPDDEAADKPAGDFAGFRTGFSLPKAGERKVESLFSKGDAAPAPETVPAPTPAVSNDNQYYSGMAPEAVGGTPHPEEDTSELAQAIAQTQEPETDEVYVAPKVEEPEPEPVKSAPVKVEPAAPPAEVAPEVNNTPMSSGQLTARMMEAEEKGLAQKTPEVASAPVAKTPAAKPKPPKLDPIQKPAEDAPAAQPVSGESKSYYIQLASAPAASDTAGKWGRMVSKYPVLLGDLTPVYQPANIPGKGDYVRIQAGPMTQAEATKRCAALRDVDPKGGCLVVRR